MPTLRRTTCLVTYSHEVQHSCWMSHRDWAHNPTGDTAGSLRGEYQATPLCAEPFGDAPSPCRRIGCPSDGILQKRGEGGRLPRAPIDCGLVIAGAGRPTHPRVRIMAMAECEVGHGAGAHSARVAEDPAVPIGLQRCIVAVELLDNRPMACCSESRRQRQGVYRPGYLDRSAAWIIVQVEPYRLRR